MYDKYVCDGQMNMMQYLNECPLTIDKPIRLIEFFAGIGSQVYALKKLGARLDDGNGGQNAYKVVEFDKYAIKSYNAIHGTNHVPIDIKDFHGSDLEVTETDKYEYVLTYSFPCQSVSIAGKQEGAELDENGEVVTRSGLVWEVIRILKETHMKPRILLMENVKNLISKRHKATFDKVYKELEDLGYKNYYQVMNAADYGIPQNRERVFMVSILGNETFEFPEPIELTTIMQDYLESDVDEKYFVGSERARELLENLVEEIEDDEEGIIYNGVVDIIEPMDTMTQTDRQTDRQTDDLSCQSEEDRKTDNSCEHDNVERLQRFRNWQPTSECRDRNYGIDFTTCNPKIIDVANCLKAKDRGVCSKRKEGSGVLNVRRIDE